MKEEISFLNARSRRSLWQRVSMTTLIKNLSLTSLAVLFVGFMFIGQRLSANQATPHSITEFTVNFAPTSVHAVVPEEQEKNRQIIKKTDFSPPLNISLVRTKKKGSIRFKEKFIDNDDWLRGLTVRVENNSSKTVTSIRVEVQFSRPRGIEHDPPAIWYLDYGDYPLLYKTEEEMPPLRVKPVLPGDSIDISLSDYDFYEMTRFLEEVRYSNGSADRIELRITDIGFSDKTIWNGGQILKRDPNSFWGWSALEDTHKEQRQIRDPPTGARHHAAYSFATDLHTSQPSTWTFVNTLGQPPLPLKQVAAMFSLVSRPVLPNPVNAILKNISSPEALLHPRRS